jgi:hypothetical protein
MVAAEPGRGRRSVVRRRRGHNSRYAKSELHKEPFGPDQALGIGLGCEKEAIRVGSRSHRIHAKADEKGRVSDELDREENCFFYVYKWEIVDADRQGFQK